MEANKAISTTTFDELFNVIKTGNKEYSRNAARAVRKLLYSSFSHGEYESIHKIIDGAPKEYVEISEDWRAENFVVAVSVLYFLHDKENQPDFLFSWLFYLLQHQNGYIRQSAVRMLEHEIGSLTVHIRCPEYKQSKTISEQSDYIILNLFVFLNNLLADLWKPVFKKYKCISSLPACPYKSIQMVMDHLEYDCGDEYIKNLMIKLNKSV